MSDFVQISPNVYADALGRAGFMDYGIKGLWAGMPRVAGPAFTVQLAAGDNLMFHAAIYEAPPGSIIVANAGDNGFAVAGGNVCAVAQKRGIVAFVIDGVIRDIAEIRAMGFPVFARGVVAGPGKKEFVRELNREIYCGGTAVRANDIIVADEEGIVVIPSAKANEVYDIAKAKAAKEETTTLEEWEAAHRAKVAKLVEEKWDEPF